jgi:hypothetical protein
MKRIFALLVVSTFFIQAFGQIKVKTTNSGLNLRSEPTTSSTVLYSLPNETELLYANDWSEGWIKVRYSNIYAFDRDESTDEVDVTGWVNAAFVETKMFKSLILCHGKNKRMGVIGGYIVPMDCLVLKISILSQLTQNLKLK